MWCRTIGPVCSSARFPRERSRPRSILSSAGRTAVPPLAPPDDSTLSQRLPQNPSPASTPTSTAPSPVRDRRWLSVVKTLFLVAALVYVGVKTAEAVQGVRTNALVSHLSPSWLLASVAFVLSAYALLIWTWLYVVRALSGRSMPYLIAARIWFISNLGKYIPGKIWQIVQMGLMSTEQGIDPVSSTAAAIVNAGVNVAMGLAVGVVAGAPLFDRLLR